MRKLIFILFVFMALTTFKRAMAQALQNEGIERAVHSDRYFRINYSNDYFTATDFYLTQAIQLELVLPALSRIPIYKLLYRPQNGETKFGLSLEHDAYTPIHYERKEIQFGDRPFAASLFLNTYVMSIDMAKKLKVNTRLSLGIIGPDAFGNNMQTYIHEKTNNVLPQGWHNQIRNDAVINYEIAGQKQLLSIPDLFTLSADGMARLGTLSTKANVGLTLMAGYFNNPFISIHVKGKKIQLYAYDHPEINTIGYDATLQGGLFNRNSVYTVPSSEISRIVFANNWGVVMQLGRLYLEYYQSYITKEFRTIMDHHNGGIQIGYSF